ncbi:LysR family transcriptional regulator [Paraburkholderia tropica]|uniref:LysR family transcriptional regulator n=1 Tax=Paraburkholderia tropica TaxID=92647 RepID=A0ABX5MXJ1_9BURK|nr:LysR family transcriptional regulator [Paraburkholderia tropica]PXX19228.1 LysR family transcriptional regulator [Paraburkholderia tropica]PZW88251.1 LysR family transcriptional regulator [Paraburkholderia tropica]
MAGITVNNLRRLDLNLLVTLDVLLDELNVTRAAERLAFSQPAVSVQLARLRDLLGDPLLLPGPRGMRPTARAESLREPLREALDALERAVAPEGPFDPSAAQHTWRVSATDYGESTVVLPALNALRATAPHTRLAVIELPPANLARAAEQGEIDLAMHIVSGAPDTLRQKLLFKERYVLAGRAGHPRLKRRPNAKQFCELEHVIVSPDGGGFRGVTDEALAQAGLARRVVLSVPHFLFVIAAISQTDLVAMLPWRLVRGNPALRLVEAPVEVPGYEMCMLWHERVHRDPAHRWLREQIAAAM